MTWRCMILVCFLWACGGDEEGGDPAADAGPGGAAPEPEPDACASDPVELLVNGDFDDQTAPDQGPWESLATRPDLTAAVVNAAATTVPADTEPNFAVFGQYTAMTGSRAVDRMSQAIPEIPEGTGSLRLRGMVYAAGMEPPEAGVADTLQVILRSPSGGQDVEVLASFSNLDVTEDFTLYPFVADSVSQNWIGIPLELVLEASFNDVGLSAFVVDSLSLEYQPACP
jgi:hypothetical protein